MRFRAFLLSLLLLTNGAAALAEEVIRSFRADIEIARSGVVTTSEAITIVAEGQRFKHGIYRDLALKPAFAGEPKSSLEVETVTRDGRPEPYRVEDRNGDKRIYVGSADVALPPGEHDYVITYRTDNRFRPAGANDMYAAHITGTWDFRIDAAEARVTLPEGASMLGTQQHAGTADSEFDFVDVTTDGRVTTFRATRPLQPGEWLAVKFLVPAGIIARPVPAQ